MKRQQIVEKIVEFLKDKNPNIINIENQTIIEIENKKNSQMIIIQVTKKCNIWVRLSEPNSGYFCESLEVFKDYFLQLINNKIEIAIGYKDSIWKESIIINSNQHSNLNSDFKYIIASWKNKSN